MNDLDIIQVADQKITAVIGNYFLVLNENKKNHTYKINKIIDLHPYGMNYYYNEESTMFYPSKDGEKYLFIMNADIIQKIKQSMLKMIKNLEV